MPSPLSYAEMDLASFYFMTHTISPITLVFHGSITELKGFVCLHTSVAKKDRGRSLQQKKKSRFIYRNGTKLGDTGELALKDLALGWVGYIEENSLVTVAKGVGVVGCTDWLQLE